MADLRGKETVAMVRSLSMVGRVPFRVSQLASLFMPYPAFSAMPTKRKSLAMDGLYNNRGWVCVN